VGIRFNVVRLDRSFVGLEKNTFSSLFGALGVTASLVEVVTDTTWNQVSKLFSRSSMMQARDLPSGYNTQCGDNWSARHCEKFGLLKVLLEGVALGGKLLNDENFYSREGFDGSCEIYRKKLICKWIRSPCQLEAPQRQPFKTMTLPALQQQVIVTSLAAAVSTSKSRAKLQASISIHFRSPSLNALGFV